MRRMQHTFWTGLADLLLAGSLFASATAATANIIGINISGATYSIDEATGVGTVVGPSGFIGTNSLARNSSGMIYSAEGNMLLTIDPATGAGYAGPRILAPGDVRGLAFSSTDVLFAIVDVDLFGGIGPDEIFTLNVRTGVASLVGATGFTGIQDIAFAPGGTLYGWDIRFGLVTIDPATGAATDVNAGLGADADIQALTFARDGTLLGAQNALFTIDPRTGASTLVGGTYQDLRGIVVIEGTVPEPGSLSLLVVGAFGMAFRQRAQSRRNRSIAAPAV